MKFGKILHLGIVVPDLDKAVSIYENTLGMGPWDKRDEREFFQMLTVNGGHGNEVITAMYFGDGFEIELLQPTGPGVFQDWLDTRGPGLHHIKFETDAKYDEIVSTCESISGRPPYFECKFPNGTPMVSYADLLDEAGLLIETGNEPDGTPMEELMKPAE